MIKVNASKIVNFGESNSDTIFCVITNSHLKNEFSVDVGEKYKSSCVFAIDSSDQFFDLMKQDVPENSHILVVLPNVYFKSPPAAILGKKRKLGVLACSSTPSNVDSIQHFIQVAENTDPVSQDAFADRLFSLGEKTESLFFYDKNTKTKAVFKHLHDHFSWHEQIGILDWGQQQLFPSGEISVLPVNVFDQNIESALDVTGELTFKGTAILHSGTPSFTHIDQQRLYEDLATLNDDSVIVSLKHGHITSLKASSNKSLPAVRALEALMYVDSRYSVLLEIGLGVNTNHKLVSGNSAMNEVYGGRKGVVHLGLGLTPYTQYHIDILCPDTILYTKEEQWILGDTEDSSVLRDEEALA